MSGGTGIFTAPFQPENPRLLIIEPEQSAAAQLLAVIGQGRHRASRIDGCAVISSLAELHTLNLGEFDLAICSTVLEDASGLDALAYMQGVRPQLPVIMTGTDANMAIEAICSGAFEFIVVRTANDLQHVPLAVEKCLVHFRMRLENERLHDELRRSLAELASTNHQLQSVIRQLEEMARTDELTGLSNRRWFNLALAGRWVEATRHELPLACLMIDLDGFKSVNDQLGHFHGDDLLRLAAKVIRANCREEDLPARFGGDEFCVLMPHTSADEAMLLANRIMREFDFAMSGRERGEPTVTMSIGISDILRNRPVNADQLVSFADHAMYDAKSRGKRRVEIYAPPPSVPATVRARDDAH